MPQPAHHPPLLRQSSTWCGRIVARHLGRILADPGRICPGLAPAWRPREPFRRPAGRGAAGGGLVGGRAAVRPSFRHTRKYGGNGGRMGLLGLVAEPRTVCPAVRKQGATAGKTGLLGPAARPGRTKQVAFWTHQGEFQPWAGTAASPTREGPGLRGRGDGHAGRREVWFTSGLPPGHPRCWLRIARRRRPALP